MQVLVSNEALNVHRPVQGTPTGSLMCHEVHGQLVGIDDTHPALEILTDTGEISIINWYHVVNVIVDA